MKNRTLKTGSRKVKMGIAAAALAGCLAAGGTAAYFTDSSTATNTFKIADGDSVDAEIEEENWDETEAEDIVPGAEFSKDPKVSNVGDMDLYAFITVSVPYAEVVLEGSDTAAGTELFSYSVNSGWTELGSYEAKDADAGTVTHVYAYTGSGSAALAALASGASTPTLFDTVKFANVKSGQGLEGTSQDIVVTGYAIQTTYLDDDTNDGSDSGTSDPAAVWEILAAQGE